jgi:predicted ester cyclase
MWASGWKTMTSRRVNDLSDRRACAARQAAAVALVVLVAGAGSLAAGEPVPEAALPQPGLVIMDKSLSADQGRKAIRAARLFYAFWSTGNPRFARLALAADFIDRTLPQGRPQGSAGPLFASSRFREAVPDLRCGIEQLIVAGDRVVAHLHFSGHFTGAFGQKQGAGQTVNFIATDILRVKDGRISENWHIEDNLTLMQQLGIVQPR